ncbi:MAG: hypothetical protein QOE16_1103 [Microbacteriaceae bacterium]|nr:hypothetical protein [Microbacteriaceae bacterium]
MTEYTTLKLIVGETSSAGSAVSAPRPSQRVSAG